MKLAENICQEAESDDEHLCCQVYNLSSKEKRVVN